MKQMRRPPTVHAVDWALRFCWLSPDGCWLYMRSTNRDGYVQVQHDGRLQTAHRLVYEREVGPIPEGLEIDHLCRRRNCLNPAHMEPVTRRENVVRGTSGQTTRDRWRSQEVCQRGHSDWGWSSRTLPSGNRVQKRHCAECRRIRDRAA